MARIPMQFLMDSATSLAATSERQQIVAWLRAEADIRKLEQRATDMEKALREIASTDFDEPSDFSELGRIARAVLSAREEVDCACTRDEVCNKCRPTSYAREESQIKTINPVSGAPYPNREDVNG